MVLFILCNGVSVEWLLLCGMLFVMYGGTIFSSVFANAEIIEMGLYEAHRLLFHYRIGMPVTSFNIGELNRF